MYDYVTIDGVDLHNVTAGVTMATEWEGLSGIPPIRSTVYDRPEADGVIEPTNQYLEARMVRGIVWTWGAAVNSAWDAWTILSKTLLANVRAQKLLKFRPLGHATADLQATARLVSASYPVFKTGDVGPYYESELIWRCSDPLNYSQTSQAAVIGAPTVTSAGMPLPIIFPIPFGITASGGSVIVTAGGNAPTWPLVTITGPINGPVIFNATQNKGLYFEGLNLAVGEQLIVDFNPNSPQSAKVNGVNKLGAIRYSDSQFFALTPGVAETVLFWGLGLGYLVGTTTMNVAWRDAYVT